MEYRTMVGVGVLVFFGIVILAMANSYYSERGSTTAFKSAPISKTRAKNIVSRSDVKVVLNSASEPELKSLTEDEKILREIRQVNDAIPGKKMSEKIDRIEELTRRILTYQKECPEQAGQLRSFLDYYLPTTLKILRSYARLDAQDVDGENISAAKSRIEAMMDQVVTGFEKQLDRLFQHEAMSVTTEVEVLENMLKKDGLSDNELTLTK